MCEMLKEKTREWEERNRGAGEKAKQGGGVVELGRRLGSEHVKGEGEKKGTKGFTCERPEGEGDRRRDRSVVARGGKKERL